MCMKVYGVGVYWVISAYITYQGARVYAFLMRLSKASMHRVKYDDLCVNKFKYVASNRIVSEGK